MGRAATGQAVLGGVRQQTVQASKQHSSTVCFSSRLRFVPRAPAQFPLMTDSDVERQAKTPSFLSWFWLVFSTAAEEQAKTETGTDGVVFLWLNHAVLERSVVAPGTLG